MLSLGMWHCIFSDESIAYIFRVRNWADQVGSSISLCLMLEMEGVCSWTVVNLYQTAWHHILEDSKLYSHSCGNFRSLLGKCLPHNITVSISCFPYFVILSITLFHQIEEEQTLINELKKIEARKKEREKKQQDLQKLITAADCQAETRKSEKKLTKKKLQHQIRPRIDPSVSM